MSFEAAKARVMTGLAEKRYSEPIASPTALSTSACDRKPLPFTSADWKSFLRMAVVSGSRPVGNFAEIAAKSMPCAPARSSPKRADDDGGAMMLVEYSGGMGVNYEAASGRDGSDNGPNAPPAFSAHFIRLFRVCY